MVWSTNNAQGNDVLTAASADRDRFPALFHLALQIISQNRELPQQLSEHLKRVLHEAAAINADPMSITSETMPEAIQLALNMRLVGDIGDAIKPDAPQTISSEVAKRILAEEHKFAAAR